MGYNLTLHIYRGSGRSCPSGFVDLYSTHLGNVRKPPPSIVMGKKTLTKKGALSSPSIPDKKWQKFFCRLKFEVKRKNGGEDFEEKRRQKKKVKFIRIRDSKKSGSFLSSCFII